MKIRIISFTRAGCGLCRMLVKRFFEQGYDCTGFAREKFVNEVSASPGICVWEGTIGEWTAAQFQCSDALIYIGAAGIAVRAIGPYLKDKMTDPAVVVVDERGNYALSLLSGHVGGANHLTRMTAEILGAVPVITTASDVQGRTAIDVWAKERQLQIDDREQAVKTAAALVSDEPVGFYSDYQLGDPVPEDFARGQMCAQNVWITSRIFPETYSTIRMFLPEDAGILKLVPRCLTVGIGCRRGAGKEQIQEAVTQALADHNLNVHAVRQFASIDLKQKEEGLRNAADAFSIPLKFYTADELSRVEKSSAESEFVRAVTGVGNVCERAALLGAGTGAELLIRKEIHSGVTVAVADEMPVISAQKIY